MDGGIATDSPSCPTSFAELFCARRRKTRNWFASAFGFEVAVRPGFSGMISQAYGR